RHGENLDCAAWLIRRRVKRVVIGILDPNPVIYATSYNRLRDAGIEVLVGFDHDLVLRIEDINRAWIREQKDRPSAPGTVGDRGREPLGSKTATPPASSSVPPEPVGISHLAGW